VVISYFDAVSYKNAPFLEIFPTVYQSVKNSTNFFFSVQLNFLKKWCKIANMDLGSLIMNHWEIFILNRKTSNKKEFIFELPKKASCSSILSSF
jgi:hypothetical protein